MDGSFEPARWFLDFVLQYWLVWVGFFIGIGFSTYQRDETRVLECRNCPACDHKLVILRRTETHPRLPTNTHFLQTIEDHDKEILARPLSEQIQKRQAERFVNHTSYAVGILLWVLLWGWAMPTAFEYISQVIDAIADFFLL